MRVTSNGEVLYPNLATTPNGTDIAINILPVAAGTGSAATFDYSAIEGSGEPGNLGKLKSMPHVVVMPPVPEEGTAYNVRYGAIEIDLSVPIINVIGGQVLDDGIAVMLDDQPQNTFNQTQLIWSRIDDSFHVMLVSPKGMYSHEARFYIVPRAIDYFYALNGAPSITNVNYYDLDGVLTSGPVLTVSSR